MKDFFYLPPAAFLVIFSVIVVLSKAFSSYAFRAKQAPAGQKKAYACGEDFQDHLIQPDYSQFFPFAFFFTILHVVVLIIATVPIETLEIFAVAALYIVGAITSLIILLRKQ